MDGKSESCLSGIEQKCVTEDECTGKNSTILAVGRRYSAPGGECLRHNIQRANSTEKAEKKDIQEKQTLNEIAESLVCETCNANFTEILEYKMHLASKSHRKAVNGKRMKGILHFFDKSPAQNIATKSQPHSFCPLCDKTFFKPEEYLQHLQRKSHKKRASLQKIFNRIMADLTDSDDDTQSEESEASGISTAAGVYSSRRCSTSSSFTTIGDESFKCKHCDKILKGNLSFAHHLASKSHAKAKRRNSLLADLCSLLSEESEGDDLSSSKEDYDGKASSE